MKIQHKIQQYISKGTCSYFNTREKLNIFFSIPRLNPSVYENLIDKGYRRSGMIFYKNICSNCSDCIPIKIDINSFCLSKSQCRVIKKNQDVKIIRNRVEFDLKDFELYKKYCADRHSKEEDDYDYTQFLIESPIITEMMRYYIDKKLIGIGWIDILPNSISSIYFVFDSDYSSRSLGVFSVIKEIELVKNLNKQWLHLGFWIKDQSKMSYKNQYRPNQILVNGVWQNCYNLLQKNTL